MKWSELRRLAEQNGWVLVRFGKKHDEYQKGSERILLEHHLSKEVKNRLYHKLIKKLKAKDENDGSN